MECSNILQYYRTAEGVTETIPQTRYLFVQVCEPNVVQLRAQELSKYQDVNESLNSKFDLANYLFVN